MFLLCSIALYIITIFWVNHTYDRFKALIHFGNEVVCQNFTAFFFQFLFEHFFERKKFIFDLDLGSELMIVPTVLG